ncbi:MAG: hypothetical protein HBSAPP02_27440 [Phycisphaerae bacterium]|nr:MAG: hypothetical protein HRU71_01370 [Planctomycetia bacterium]GJQ27712.1 MAG: hypothetical protein HBSAPP02_27440 [Phycisphaerae bacterium]
MRNIFMKSYTISANWQKLADTRTVLVATLIASPLNAGALQVRVDGGPTSLWSKGVSATLFGVDISRIEVKGNAGDMALVVGTG